MLLIALLLLVLAPQLLAAMQRKSAAFRIALLLPSMGLASMVASWSLTQSIHLTSTRNGQIESTYYVVSHVHFWLSHVLALGTLSALLYAADPDDRPLPAFTRGLSTLLGLGTAVIVMRPMIFAQLISPPKRYADFATWTGSVERLEIASVMLFTITFLTLLLISLYAILRRLNEWSKAR